MKTLRLGDVAEKIGSGATPRGGNSVYQTEGIALIRSQNIYNDGFHRDGLAFISDGHADELSNVEVQTGDVLLNITGDSVARVCQVPDDVLPARVNQHVAIIRPVADKLDARYLRYFLASPATQDYMLALAAAGATRNALTKGMIEDFEIPARPLPEQRAIAGVLGALDDKIELNRRMNETLEAIAKAEFRRMKEEGGGRDVALGEICEVAIGGDWGEDNSFESAVEVICLRGVDLEHLRQTGYADAPRRWVKQSSAAQRHLDERDVLIAASGLGPTGRPLWACAELEKVFGLPVIYSNFCKRLRCESPAIAVFVDCHLHEMRESGEIWEYVNGTSIPNLDAKGLLSGHRLIIPSQAALNRFYDFIQPIVQKLYSEESRTLAALRDALLPKLLSGAVRVRQKG
jgi:type I restriction enzyme S subunit